jgi:signal transduction histidine kinase
LSPELPLRTLRARLIAMVAALLAVILGGIAVVSLRVAHYEIRKFQIAASEPRSPLSADALREHYRARGNWSGVQPLIDRMARAARSEVLLFDGQRKLVASSPLNLAPANVAPASAGATLSPDDVLTIERRLPGGRVREILRGPQEVIRGADGRDAGYLFILPRHEPDEQPPTRALDLRFLAIFLAAAIFGIVMAAAIARWTTVPIERLTAATRRMEQGDLAVRVQPSGGVELSELARGFNAMAAALDRNEEVRRRMVSDVAHELRAPLTNIRCELESMQDGLTAPTAERIASLHQETMQLARLVDDLQELALAEAGKLTVAIENVSVDALARRAVAAMQSRSSITLDGDDGVVVRADPTRAVQILTNLLANAVAHSNGNITVRWRAEGSEAVIEVIDRGEGIPAADLPRVFDRFYRVDASRSRTTGGAGLGLAIVGQLVAAQGGRVWAASEVGKGSTFSFTLPLA